MTDVLHLFSCSGTKKSEKLSPNIRQTVQTKPKNHTVIFLFFLVLVGGNVVALLVLATMRVQIHLRAEKLKNIARGKWRGKCSSPYVVVDDNTTNNAGAFLLVGTTEVQQNDLSPNFATSIIVNHDESVGWTHLRITIRDCQKYNNSSKKKSQSQRINVRHYHRPLHHFATAAVDGVGAGLNTILDYGNNKNNNNDDEDYRSDSDPIMGQVDIELGNILQCKGQEQEIQLSEGGKLFVHVTPSIQGTNPSGIFHCQIRGLDCKNIESGLLGLGAVDPYYVISKKYNDTQSGLSRWYVVYKSEYIHDIINPYWSEFQMDLERLCNNDWNKPLKIAIYDQEDYGADRWLGEVETSVAEMLRGVAKCGNADRESALRVVAVEEDGKEDLRALLVILKADVILSK